MRRDLRSTFFGVVSKLLPGDHIHDVAPSSKVKQTTAGRIAQIDAANAKACAQGCETKERSMTQPDLFDRQSIGEKFTRSGTSIVLPAPDELACVRRDSGMQRAAEHAGREWQDRAVGFVRRYARLYPRMLAENVRAMADANGFASPSNKAWGPVMQRAAREGIIKADGYAPANSSNRSPKTQWRSLL